MSKLATLTLRGVPDSQEYNGFFDQGGGVFRSKKRINLHQVPVDIVDQDGQRFQAKICRQLGLVDGYYGCQLTDIVELVDEEECKPGI